MNPPGGKHTFSWLMLASSLLAGCAGQAQLGEVEGTVRIKGKPLANVQVEFLPEGNGPRSIGATDEQGRYVLTCADQRKGALVGRHRVVVLDLKVYEQILGKGGRDNETPAKASRVPMRYTEAGRTPLKKEVQAGTNVIDLEVIVP